MKKPTATDVPEPDQALQSARNCRHYAMCKIDFLGCGVCSSGPEHGFVAFYPEGRMDLYVALKEERIPLTPAALAIVQSCSLCGRCDIPCHFVTGLRPLRVMEALKRLVAERLESGEPVAEVAEDDTLRRLRAIVGARWASADPALLVTYAYDPCPTAPVRMPSHVVMPGSADEVAGVLSLLEENGIPWTARANGTNILGLSLSDGVVIDLNRMQEISFCERDWKVRVGPGVSAFELQRAAFARGYRVNVAEPAALVVGSLMCSGILSLFATAYGTSADNLVDARFVGRNGGSFTLNQKGGPNHFAFSSAPQQSPGICVEAEFKLHPVSEDESGVLVPFDSLSAGIAFARDCAQRRIGFAVGLLSPEYVAAFMAPTRELAHEVKGVLQETLGMACLVLVLGDRYALESVRAMGHPLIDQALFRVLSLGLPRLGQARWVDLLARLSGEEPFSYLDSAGFMELAEVALDPSPARLATAVEPDLREEYQRIYSRPELTDLVWLNMFRITSSRVGRDKHFVPLLVYLPLEAALIEELCQGFRAIAARLAVKNEVGFIAPVHEGKRCIFEYDYYADPGDPEDLARVRLALREAASLIEEACSRTGTIRWLRDLQHQTMARSENLLFA